MKVFKKMFITISIGLVSLPVFSAGQVTSAKVPKIYCGYYNGANMCSIYFDKDITNQPACHTNNRKRMQIKADDDTGKAILSLAMMAYATQKSVTASGKGNCNVWSDTEDLNVLTIE
jgi:hypothetical protein